MRKMKLKSHKVVTILYLDVRSKDVYNQRPLLGANTLIYDSTGNGRPIYIPANVLAKAKYDEKIPLILGHENKHFILGFINNIKYNVITKMLYGDINVDKRWNKTVLRKFSEGVNGLSVEFGSIDKSQGYFDQVIELHLTRVAIVDNPAYSGSVVY